MKRFWIGVAFLVLLLAGSVFLLAFSGQFYQDLVPQLEEAGTLALEENWPAALENFKISQKNWEKNQHFLAAFTDHEPMEQVDQLFAQLALYGEKRMSVEFAVTCTELRHLAKAIDETHSLKWWTVL